MKTLPIFVLGLLIAAGVGFLWGKSVQNLEPSSPAPREDPLDDARRELDALKALYRGRLEALNTDPSVQPQAAQQNSTLGDSDDDAATVTLDAVRDQLLSGELALELIDGDSIESTLERVGRHAPYLLAAAQLAGGDQSLAYLSEALELDPDSPEVLAAILQHHLSEGRFDEEGLGHLDHLMEVDPDNALPHYYSALHRIGGGDLDGALEALRTAGDRTRMTSYSMTAMPATRAFYEDVGCSPAVASMLSMYGVQLPHVGALRELQQGMAEQAESLSNRGARGAALEWSTAGYSLGHRMSVSGRTLIEELVGHATEERFLRIERGLQSAGGEATRVGTIDRRLSTLDHRRDRVRSGVSEISEIFGRLTEDDLELFIGLVQTEGELDACRQLRGIIDARE